MWDMMLMGGGPYGRRHKGGGGHRRGKTTHGRCRACREPIGKVTLYGKRVDLAYCQRHHCQKVTGSTICQEQRNGRNPSWQYCDMRECCWRVLDRVQWRWRYGDGDMAMAMKLLTFYIPAAQISGARPRAPTGSTA